MSPEGATIRPIASSTRAHTLRSTVSSTSLKVPQMFCRSCPWLAACRHREPKSALELCQPEARTFWLPVIGQFRLLQVGSLMA